MATKKTNKPRGGSVCAVSTCVNYSGKSKHEGRTDVSFHRFPKDLTYQKQWIRKCKRADKFNPSSSFICSDHFNNNDFIRNLQAELLGYTSKRRRLKPDAIPTLNLRGNFIQGDGVSASAMNRNKRMETKAAKQAHDEIITLALNAEIPSVLNQLPSESIDENKYYKTLYYDLIKKHDKLKTEFSLQEKELISVKDACKNYNNINESLRCQIKQLQKNVNDSNKILKQNEITTAKQIKLLTENKKRTIEIEAMEYFSTIFSKNQLDLIMKKKKQVHWTRYEMSKAFILRYISKQAYDYVKNELNYPLPGLSSLQRWAQSADFRNGVVEDVLKIMKLNSKSMKSYENVKVLMFDENLMKNVEATKSSTVTNSEIESPQKIDINKKEIEEDEIEYLAEWVANKYKLQYPELTSTTTYCNSEQSMLEHDYTTSTWINHSSCGGIIVSSHDFKTKILRIERLLKKITKNEIPKRPGIVKRLTKKIMCRMEIDKKYEPVVQSYIKQRLIIGMKYFNRPTDFLL